MTATEYRDVDCPFCIKCSRFMIKFVGKIRVLLNHESDEIYLVRDGLIYKCPECGYMVVYKWLKPYRIPRDLFLTTFNDYIKRWFVFLEDHKHYNFKRPGPPPSQ